MTSNSNKQYSILIVDDDDDILKLLDSWLTGEQFTVINASSGVQALEILSNNQPDLIITDLFMEDMNGMELLNEVHGKNPLMPVIMLSGQAQIPDAIKAMHLGCSEFLTKPVDKAQLLNTVVQLLPSEQKLKHLEELAGDIVYESEAMRDVLEMVSMIAETNVSVFISGPTGSGKEVIAKAIHQASKRKDMPFIAVNCGAIPEQLLESELFGHEKGAFTGANIRHEGLFKAANGGTIFLDEIGDMPPMLQVKLLRVLQDFEIRPVGSTKTFPIDVRLISATHRDLESAVNEGEFREDLYYRLKVVPISIPALVERIDDLPSLTEHFLKRFSDINETDTKKFSKDALEYLKKLSWAGNVRQLMNVVELCATLSRSRTISLNMVKKAIQDKPVDIKTLKEAKMEFEKNYLISVMRVAHGHVANAAKMAGRNRTEFYKLLNQYSIEPDTFRNKKS